MDFRTASAASALERANSPLGDEATRRQEEYEIELAIRLDMERDMHPDQRLDELAHEIFRLALYLGDSADSAVTLAMKDPLTKRVQIRDDLQGRLAHELDWLADNCRTEPRTRIRTVPALMDAEDFLVSPRCCDDYCRLTRRVKPRESADRLRREVRARGRFVRRGSDYLLTPARRRRQGTRR
jgi:hypothetical protein